MHHKIYQTVSKFNVDSNDNLFKEQGWCPDVKKEPFYSKYLSYAIRIVLY